MSNCEPQAKKQKNEEDNSSSELEQSSNQMEISSQTCQHYVTRKKRFCKMSVSNGKQFCGEHDVKTSDIDPNRKRIPCPLDAKHTVYTFNLNKHLKICNARPKVEIPDYINYGINNGTDDESEVNEEDQYESCKLSQMGDKQLQLVIDKVNQIYDKYINNTIKDLYKDHALLRSETENELYGLSSLKHLIQTSSILGCLDYYDLLKPKTCFIEFGAGKGQVSYWLAKATSDTGSTVVLVDRASHRHKKDNKLENRACINRVRADIVDLNIKHLEFAQKCEQIVGVSKHLCGAATDLALRCIMNGNKLNENQKIEPQVIPTKGIFIALCCHHRCDWKVFVGKEFLREHKIRKFDFNIMIKMVSWAVCGSGMSRERRKELLNKSLVNNDKKEDKTNPFLSQKHKEEIGIKCKRVLDFARLKYLEKNGYNCSLCYYVKKDISLENVCIIGILKQ